jgi:hypothetical protein
MLVRKSVTALVGRMESKLVESLVHLKGLLLVAKLELMKVLRRVQWMEMSLAALMDSD